MAITTPYTFGTRRPGSVAELRPRVEAALLGACIPQLAHHASSLESN